MALVMLAMRPRMKREACILKLREEQEVLIRLFVLDQFVSYDSIVISEIVDGRW